ncbi:hypodermin-B-like [Bradysia coprophila]|uniref:hypodermin-B-like n=1 Tax=Bradysia coprophila TaxID=38358 RepID=UPI00187DA02F|nr:hypodermin-B-like [Bradysia coprophila]
MQVANLIVYHISYLLGIVKLVSCGARISNGYLIDIEQAPYMARVGNGYGKCGGSIVSSQFILTAGHCVSFDFEHSTPKVIDPEMFDIRVGSAYSDEGGELYNVEAVYAKFENGGNDNDIGMLKLKKPISLDGSTKKTIKLPRTTSYYPKDDTDVYIQGFGTNPNNPDTYQMSRANSHTITTDQCNNELKGEAGVTKERQICAKGDNDESGPCAGDSGSPLVTRDRNPTQIGVDSRGPGGSREDCKNQGGGQPSVFTSVSGNLDWIKGVMNGSVKPNSPGSTAENPSGPETKSETEAKDCHKNSKPTPKPTCHTHSD